jgi:hypothetical protein
MNLDRPAPIERLGIALGAGLSPLVASLSGARRARMFHPDGVVFSATVQSVALTADLAKVAERLAGNALVRFSGALWRYDREWPDVLGAAIRFHFREPVASEQQDLLLATIRSPWTMPFSPFATNFRSYLWNHYHAVSPFEVEGVGRVKIRLRSPRIGNGTAASRTEHLGRLVADGAASFELQLRRLDTPLLARKWEPAARLTLVEPLDTDQAALRFSPFRAGGGLQPVGFVHALRLAAYAASQAARPTHRAAPSSPGLGQ